MKHITLQEAKETIELYPTLELYVDSNIQTIEINGYYDDNSIELREYWKLCEKVLSEAEQN